MIQVTTSKLFRQRLHAAARTNASWLCIGLDPDARLVPTSMRGKDPQQWLAPFLLDIVAATSDLVCCYKPNIGFFEQFGMAGQAALREVVRGVPSQIPVLLDAKRGDAPHTMQAYARAIFEDLGVDAVTLNPYMGADSLEPFFAYPDRGVFVLCKTSNPGAGEIQDLVLQGDSEPLYVRVARRALSWDQHGTLGLVVGATYPADVARVRGIAPEVPILLPGVGAQAGELERSVSAGVDARGENLIVNASRSVLYAAEGDQWQDAARAEAERLRAAIRAASSGSTATPAR